MAFIPIEVLEARARVRRSEGVAENLLAKSRTTIQNFNQQSAATKEVVSQSETTSSPFFSNKVAVEQAFKEGKITIGEATRQLQFFTDVERGGSRIPDTSVSAEETVVGAQVGIRLLKDILSFTPGAFQGVALFEQIKGFFNPQFQANQEALRQIPQDLNTFNIQRIAEETSSQARDIIEQQQASITQSTGFFSDLSSGIKDVTKSLATPALLALAGIILINITKKR